MNRHTLKLTRPDSPLSPALYYAGQDDDGGFRWTPELLRCKGLHGLRYAERLLPAARKWAELHYLGTCVVETVGTYADLHGAASKEAAKEVETGRSASVVEAERLKKARQDDKALGHAKVGCRICGGPVKLTGRMGRGAACCSDLCRVEYKAKARRKQKAYNAKYYADNKARIYAQREEAQARHSEREGADNE